MNRIRLALLCSANLLAACGGGVLFGTALNSLKDARMLKPGDAIFVYIYGSILALLILSLSPQWLKKRGITIFSLATACVVWALIYELQYSHGTKWLGENWIFGLLCMHFCFFITARGLRSDISAGLKSQLPWVELFFYLGWILGLIVERYFTPEPVSMEVSIQLLSANLILQLIAGGFDLIAVNARRNAAGSPEPTEEESKSIRFDWWRYARLTAALCTFYACIEAVFWGFVTQMEDSGRKEVATYALVVSYLGSALASIFYARQQVRLRLPSKESFERGFKRAGEANAWSWPLSFVAVLVLAGGLTALLLYQPLNRLLITVVLIVVFFLIEIVYLVFGDQIGEEAKLAGRSGLVAVTLGLIALSMASAIKIVVSGNGAATTGVLIAGIGLTYLILLFKTAGTDVNERDKQAHLGEG
ncbi:MAG TPA: hypothetical protein VJ464_01840 [Blastocatellia bacterium]|nr:hypothetical protein [Blastocatellia bacterium]